MNELETAVLSGRQLRELTGIAAHEEVDEHFLDMGVTNVAITLGARGTYFVTHKGDSDLVEAEKDVAVVDTTGAGVSNPFL
jgi:ribokinase